MVQMYTIAGRQIGSHYLAMGVLATLFGGAFYGTSGSKPKATATPPINASSSDEADFIKCVISPGRTPIPHLLTRRQNRKFLDSADKDEKAKH
ncbi:hypothetical protein COL5a_006079 [Colletotrichum fioriniae]|nr:uncharacterized protein COL516b_004517 [Colletotrichum fioriniae]KAJ0306723.1 hypothetical protein COL516b_004517 [Colletotrichum fioriniae]KAJ0327287.1 hypothetical protein COL5a_006079 [Colletotrichum fioriniae]